MTIGGTIGSGGARAALTVLLALPALWAVRAAVRSWAGGGSLSDVLDVGLAAPVAAGLIALFWGASVPALLVITVATAGGAWAAGRLLYAGPTGAARARLGALVGLMAAAVLIAATASTLRPPADGSSMSDGMSGMAMGTVATLPGHVPGWLAVVCLIAAAAFAAATLTAGVGALRTFATGAALQTDVLIGGLLAAGLAVACWELGRHVLS